MTKLQFIAVSLGMFGLGMIFSYSGCKEAQKELKQSPKIEHYKYENSEPSHKIKVVKHKAWYGDTMLVTIDTTYFYEDTVK